MGKNQLKHNLLKQQIKLQQMIVDNYTKNLKKNNLQQRIGDAAPLFVYPLHRRLLSDISHDGFFCL